MYSKFKKAQEPGGQAMLDELNKNYSIDRALFFESGKSNFIKFRMQHQSGSACEVYLYGGHLTSWSKPEYGELLFLSEKAEFKKGKAIRGGIPVIFPQFGGGKLPSHGFARNREWNFIESKLHQNKDIIAVLELEEDTETLGVWPYKFSFRIEFILSEKLSIKVSIQNNDSRPFEFQQALHTYFKISNIEDVEVAGLKDIRYIDKVNNNQEVLEVSEMLKFTTSFDRVYQGTSSVVSFSDPVLKRKFNIQKEGMTDTVLWNPWESSVSIADMHENAYQKMICVESANVVPAVRLNGNEIFQATQIIEVVNC